MPKSKKYLRKQPGAIGKKISELVSHLSNGENQFANGEDHLSNGENQFANGDGHLSNGENQFANGDGHLSNGENY